MTLTRLTLTCIFLSFIGTTTLQGSPEDLEQNEQSHYILPRHMMSQLIERMSFPEVMALEQVNKSLYDLCSQWVVYKYLVQNWKLPREIHEKYQLDSPRKKFHHMLKNMPEFQVYIAELWQLHFPIGRIASASFAIPRAYYWPQAHGVKSNNKILQLFDQVLKSVSNSFCSVRGRALLGIHAITRPPYEYPMTEIVNAHIFKLRYNQNGKMRKFADVAYPINLRLRALILAQDIYDNNYAALIDKLTAAKMGIFPLPKAPQEDFQMELLRIHMLTLMGDMLFEGKGANDPAQAKFYYLEVLDSPYLSPEIFNHIGSRVMQIQQKNGEVTDIDYTKYMLRLLEDPYTNLKSKTEICNLFPDHPAAEN